MNLVRKALGMDTQEWAHISAVVMDLDGTLVHSARDLIEGVRRTFRDLGLGKLPESYQPQVLHGTMLGVMRAACRDVGLAEPAQWPPVLEYFFSLYAAMNAPTAHLYEGVAATLAQCHAQGLLLAVCTNSSERIARATLDKLGVLSQMAFICGADTFGVAKPDARPLLGVLQALGVAPQDSLYVGDTGIDACCAQAAGVRFAWHRQGYGGNDAEPYPRALGFHAWHELAAYCAPMAAR